MSVRWKSRKENGIYLSYIYTRTYKTKNAYDIYVEQVQELVQDCESCKYLVNSIGFVLWMMKKLNIFGVFISINLFYCW
jgi:hypothetical protein